MALEGKKVKIKRVASDQGPSLITHSCRVFEGLRVTQNNYTGHVIFLEEDHYASPDLLHVFDLMKRLRPALCPTCKVFALGNYNKMNPKVYKNFVSRGISLVLQFFFFFLFWLMAGSRKSLQHSLYLLTFFKPLLQSRGK